MENIVFEILPPPINWGEEKIANYSQNIVKLLKRQNVLYIGIPEVINEGRNGKRNWPFSPKMDNVLFSQHLQRLYPNITPIIYKICVRQSKESFLEWVAKVFELGFRHVVLVGGENHHIDYPGYSVVEAARIVKSSFPEIKIGGIAIFTRHCEAKRLIEKMKAGIEFFFSQIIFEAANMKQIMLNLSKLCKEQELAMPKLFLSLALAAKVKDIEFMQWLGVEFPTAVSDYLSDRQIEKVENRSLEVVEVMLDEIFHFIHKEKIHLGFNIEHLLYTNLPLSENLFNKIKQRIEKDAYFTAGTIS